MPRTKTHTPIISYHHHHIFYVQLVSWHILTPLQRLLLHHFSIHLLLSYLFLSNPVHITPYLRVFRIDLSPPQKNPNLTYIPKNINIYVYIYVKIFTFQYKPTTMKFTRRILYYFLKTHKYIHIYIFIFFIP